MQEGGLAPLSIASWDQLLFPDFEYEPLSHEDSIRVIEIQPGSRSQAVTCSLRPCRLSDKPAYEAASYTWGDPIDRRNISITSGSNLYKLSVTANCESLLRKLRLANETRVVWVDAICIDQSNILERNQQVALMKDVYRNANRVVIDVGDSEERTHTSTKDIFINNGSAGSEEALYFLANCKDDDAYGFEIGLVLINTLNSFFGRPWFQRIWVLQEVYMAQTATVLCGDDEGSWTTITPRRIWHEPYMEKEWPHVTIPHTIPPVLKIGNCESRPYTARSDLSSLLRRNRMCQATDLRDKVFALLGMISDAKENGLVADYRNCPAQVFTETTAWLLRNVGLSALCGFRGSGNIPGLPSWVVDWSDTCSDESTIGLGLGHPLKAGGNTQLMVEVLDSGPPPVPSCSYEHHGADCSGIPRVLKVRGLRFDEVLRVLPARYHSGWEGVNKEEEEFISGIARHKPEMAPRSPSPSHHYPLGEDELQNATPFPENAKNRSRLEDPEAHEARSVRVHNGRQVRVRHGKSNEPYYVLPAWATHQYGLPFEWDSGTTDSDAKEKFIWMYQGRNLIMTERGYFGFAPMNTQPGDLICVFLGGATPFVLREDQYYEGIQYFRFIGEAYIYWIMEGEALIQVESEKSDKVNVDFYIV